MEKSKSKQTSGPQTPKLLLVSQHVSIRELKKKKSVYKHTHWYPHPFIYISTFYPLGSYTKMLNLYFSTTFRIVERYLRHFILDTHLPEGRRLHHLPPVVSYSKTDFKIVRMFCLSPILDGRNYLSSVSVNLIILLSLVKFSYHIT